ncbi:MAG: winged helix-turn-helix domain-containing protein [Planctomycetaceae bacterium]|jgi:hypothetical protein|nr:winged helix-turn-helix domain-containing protein [Planctomycetaceae bacterium]
MKANRIEESKIYELKIGKNTTLVKVVSIERRVNGSLVFVCKNTNTDKLLTVADADRFVKIIKTNDDNKSNTSATSRKKEHINDDGTMSGINAAHRVLIEAGKPLNAREIYETAVERGYCKLNGATPILTISAVIQLDIKKHGSNSRFKKAGRGLFAAQ